MSADNRYWYIKESNASGWLIQTWRGERHRDNVITVGLVDDLASAETICNELNHLYRQAMRGHV